MTSSTVRLYSGNSSRNNTPLCAKEISPGCGYPPPPTRATSVIQYNVAVKLVFVKILSLLIWIQG